MKQDYKYMVYVRCLTYNHAMYIEDTLNGFAIQQTDFPFVCCIVDDASADGEQSVIRRYLEDNFVLDHDNVRLEETVDYKMIFARHRENKNCYFAVYLLKYNHYGKKSKFQYLKEWDDKSKYFAMCEGDDYWTSPNKLQKQVAFLETHPEYSLCVHDFKKYIQNENKFVDNKHYNENFTFDYEYYLNNLPTQLLTAVAKNSAIPSIEIRNKYRYFRDNHIYYYILQHGKGYYIAENMGVYRITGKGIWTSLNYIEKIEIDLRCYVELYEHHPEEEIFRNKCVELYSSYLFVSKMNHSTPKNIKCSALGLASMIEIFLRYYVLLLHAVLRPELKKRVLINN